MNRPRGAYKPGGDGGGSFLFDGLHDLLASGRIVLAGHECFVLRERRCPNEPRSLNRPLVS